VSFCDPEERPNLKAIEKLIRKSIPVRNDHPTYVAQQPQSQVLQPQAHQAPAHKPRQAHATPRTAVQTLGQRHRGPAGNHRGHVNSHRGRPASRGRHR
jgi:hypothetical protein